MVRAGACITVSNVLYVSPTRRSSSFGIGSGARRRPREVTVTNPSGGGGALTNGFTVNLPAAVTLAYNGKLRDKVGGGDTVLGGDGAADATMIGRASWRDRRTVTVVQVSNGIGGTWDTTGAERAGALRGAPW